jgi:hypothetical protein
MGAIVAYARIELWRSIFDYGEVGQIARYEGDCAATEEAMRKRASTLKPKQ